MIFASDNWAGASPAILEAIAVAMRQPAPAYGTDDWTRRAEQRLSALFEREAAVFFVTSGTAANVLALSHLGPPWGAVYCHATAHIHTSECGGLEGQGRKLVPLVGDGTRVTADALEAAVAAARRGDAHSIQPATVSITNISECGTVYSATDVAALGAVCRSHGLRLHMDGARFANALATLGCTPAELTWKAGVDALSFGATKCGAVAAEAVVFFDPALAQDFAYRRMRGGQLLSKMRFVSAQMLAWLDGGHWLAMATQANAMAQRLATGFAAVGVRAVWPVEGNMVFAVMSDRQVARLTAAGAALRATTRAEMCGSVELGAGEAVYRHVCSFASTADEVDHYIDILSGR